MPSPDIIVPLTNDPNGPQAWVYIDCVSLDRQGSLPLVTPAGTKDKWRICTVARAVLAQGGVALLDKNNKEIPTSVPDGFRAPEIDVARLVHDPRVLLLVAGLRDVLIDLHTGVLVPATIPLEPNP